MCNVHVPFYHHVTLDAALSNAHAQWITCFVQFIVFMRMSHFTTWSRHTLSGTVYCTNAIYQVALVSSIVIMRMCSLPSGAFAHAQLDHVAPSGHLAAQIFLLILSARWLKAKAEHRLYTHALMHIYYPQHTHTLQKNIQSNNKKNEIKPLFSKYLCSFYFKKIISFVVVSFHFRRYN